MKVPEIVKEFCVVSDSTWEALQEKTIPKLGSVYRVHNLESKRCQAFPTMHYVTVTLTEVPDEATTDTAKVRQTRCAHCKKSNVILMCCDLAAGWYCSDCIEWFGAKANEAKE